MLRASNYNIYVDLPNTSQEILLVHGYSGAYDKVSKQVVNYIRSLETRPHPRPLFGTWNPRSPVEEVISPPNNVITLLKQCGYLTQMNEEEEEAFFTKVATTIHNKDLNRNPNYIFMPTYDCNLRCGYCFQDHMRTNSAHKHLLRFMMPELVERIFAVVPKIETLHGLSKSEQHQRNITFFGGEPLLEKTYSIIKHIMAKALEIGDAQFSAITNGTELHAYRDLLGPNKLAQLQITLDGPPAEHNQRRIYADGNGSYDRIAQNITMALDLDVAVVVRMNIDRNNIEQLPLLADEIIARGWHSYAKFSTYTAPIHASNGTTPAKTTLTTWELDKAITEIRQKYPSTQVIDRPDDRLENKILGIFGNKSDPLPEFKSSFCGAHNGMYIFDAFGDIYACWERTGDEKIRLGHVGEDGELNLNQYNQLWRSRTVVSNPICRQCRFALYCGGGCAVLAESNRGAFFTNHCDGFAARFRSSVANAYMNHVNGGEVTLEESFVCDR